MFNSPNKHGTQAIFSISLIIIGIFTALFFDQIRYTQYVEPKINEMSPADVYESISNQPPESYLFLDVRSDRDYEKIHAEHSNSYPIATLFDTWKKLPRDKDTKIYLICTGGRLSGIAYSFLQLHGFRNIVHVDGGIEKWSASGLPTISPSLFPESL